MHRSHDHYHSASGDVRSPLHRGSPGARDAAVAASFLHADTRVRLRVSAYVYVVQPPRFAKLIFY